MKTFKDTLQSWKQKFNCFSSIAGNTVNMQLIIILGLIAKLALVSGDCEVEKAVSNFDYNKVSTQILNCFLYQGEIRWLLVIEYNCGVLNCTVSRSGHT
jgi:hypothetical protein